MTDAIYPVAPVAQLVDSTDVMREAFNRLTTMRWQDKVTYPESLWIKAWNAALDNIQQAPSNRAAAVSDPVQNGYIQAIEVEKLLCAKLEIPWSATGMSIVSLIERLISR
jgi:hypothetical protein